MRYNVIKQLWYIWNKAYINKKQIPVDPPIIFKAIPLQLPASSQSSPSASSTLPPDLSAYLFFQLCIELGAEIREIPAKCQNQLADQKGFLSRCVTILEVWLASCNKDFDTEKEDGQGLFGAGEWDGLRTIRTHTDFKRD